MANGVTGQQDELRTTPGLGSFRFRKTTSLAWAVDFTAGDYRTPDRTLTSFIFHEEGSVLSYPQAHYQFTIRRFTPVPTQLRIQSRASGDDSIRNFGLERTFLGTTSEIYRTTQIIGSNYRPPRGASLNSRAYLLLTIVYSGGDSIYGNDVIPVRVPSKDITLGAGSFVGCCGDGTTIWFLKEGTTNDTMIAYKASDLTRDRTRDVSVSGTNNSRVFAYNNIVWVGAYTSFLGLRTRDDGGYHYKAYNASNSSRLTNIDFKRLTRGYSEEGRTTYRNRLYIINYIRRNYIQRAIVYNLSSTASPSYIRDSNRLFSDQDTDSLVTGITCADKYSLFRFFSTGGFFCYDRNSLTAFRLIIRNTFGYTTTLTFSRWGHRSFSYITKSLRNIRINSATSDGTTFWLLDNNVNKAYAFTAIRSSSTPPTTKVRNIWLGDQGPQDLTQVPKQPTDIRLGSTAVQKVYVGTTLVWER